MKVGIIGAGKVGTAFAQGLKSKGFLITGIYSNSNESSTQLNEKLEICLSNDLALTVRNSELLLLAVPDSKIEWLAEEIENKVDSLDICWKTFLHLSGSMTSEVLEPIKRKGGYAGSLHPIQTFADKEEAWKGIEGIYFGYEGSVEARRIASEVVKTFNGTMLTIKKEDKPIYHAAACILSNYVVTLAYTAGNMFNQIGLDNDTAALALMPLVNKTLGNIEASGAIASLTGPISRGDTKVVEGHISSMKNKSPGTLEMYKALGRITVDIALRKGSIDEKTAGKLYIILA